MPMNRERKKRKKYLEHIMPEEMMTNGASVCWGWGVSPTNPSPLSGQGEKGFKIGGIVDCE